jgi:branched-chain amino acid transport system ATP-binding protein
MTLLKADRLTKSFGDLVAVNEIDLEVESGTLHSVIGPNGAGKTTLFNLITGELKPTAGDVLFNGRKVTGLPSHKIPHIGISRSFQRTNVFPNFTVYDNVWVAAFFRIAPKGINLLRRITSYSEIADRVNEALCEVELSGKAVQKACELSHGDQRVLEVAIALASSPILLLLDEPTSGLSAEETRRMTTLIKNLSQRYTMLIIEHKMNVIMSISDRISVMHFGRIIAEGPPEEIQANEDVRKAYLGRWR